MTHPTQTIQRCRLAAFMLAFLILGVAAAGGFGMVWLRQDMAARARNTVQFEREVREVERQTSALDARIARAHSPQFLAARVPVDLRPTQAHQIVWMPPTEALTPARTGEVTHPAHEADPRAVRSPATAHATAGQAGEESPRLITFDLALINQQRAGANHLPRATTQ